MRAAIVCLLFVSALAANANAEQIYGKPYGYEDVEWRFSDPSTGPATASVGSEMVSRVRIGTARITHYEGPRRIGIKGGNLWNDSYLALTELSSGIAACKYDYSVKLCLVDQDKDGQFEAGGRLTAAGLELEPLKAPLPYAAPRAETVRDPAGDLRASLVFLGEAAGVLRFAHREYKADLARPAFTEELSFPKPATFPAEIAIKDLLIEVQGVSNAGIRYVIKKVGGATP